MPSPTSIGSRCLWCKPARQTWLACHSSMLATGISGGNSDLHFAWWAHPLSSWIALTIHTWLLLCLHSYLYIVVTHKTPYPNSGHLGTLSMVLCIERTGRGLEARSVGHLCPFSSFSLLMYARKLEFSSVGRGKLGLLLSSKSYSLENSLFRVWKMAQCFESIFYCSREPSTLTWLSTPTLGQMQPPVTAVLGGYYFLCPPCVFVHIWHMHAYTHNIKNTKVSSLAFSFLHWMPSCDNSLLHTEL